MLLPLLQLAKLNHRKLTYQYNQPLVMPPFEEEGVYCFANISWSVDQMVSADFLNTIYHSLHISYVDWSQLVDDPY